MAHSRGNLVTALLLFSLQITTPAKNNASPVYEIINEQARMDDIRLPNAPTNIPYGNPLAGNSAQNARLHASNQQAMFNAERIRQHRAQLQRLNQGPPLIDSYMKAYHDSQESHQLALEEQQATVKVTTTPATNMRKPIRSRTSQNRQRPSNRDESEIKRQESKSRTINVEPEKITRNRVVKERGRNHRSYGSVQYEQYLQSKFPLAYLTATADQGVNIKSNGNSGISKEQNKEASISHPIVIPSSSKYLPNGYDSLKEIKALESILRKKPYDQLSELKTLIHTDTITSQNYFEYPLKEESDLQTPELYNETLAHDPSTYASAYAVRDHTPITEEIDDVDNPMPYYNTFVSTQLTTVAPVPMVTNYYKVEVASQIISSPFKANSINEELHLNQDQGRSYEDISESYINYPNGVQHLSEDGTGVSAYGDENVSSKLRFKRSELDTKPFLQSNETTTQSAPNHKLIASNITDNPTAEALRRPFYKKRNDFNVFLTPDFQIGEAADYDYEETPKVHPTSKFYDDDEYYDDFGNEYDEPRPISLAEQPLQDTRVSYPSDSKGSFSNRYGEFRRQRPVYGPPAITSYGVPTYEPQAYNQSPYIPSVNSLVPNVPEPVYILTQSQLKQLIGQPNLNIEHLDVYQVSKEKKKMHYPRQYRKRYPYSHRNIRNKLQKLHKLKLV